MTSVARTRELPFSPEVKVDIYCGPRTGSSVQTCAVQK
jgi:hypothetical protein